MHYLEASLIDKGPNFQKSKKNMNNLNIDNNEIKEHGLAGLLKVIE